MKGIFSEEQIKLLNRPLDASRIKTREGKYSYLTGEDVQRTANTIFGFGGWSTITQTNDVVSVSRFANSKQDNKKVRRTVGLLEELKPNEREGWTVWYKAIVHVHVTGPNGTNTFSGTGYGSGENQPDLGGAHEQAGKEAETDAEKRALKKYGDQFGLTLWDAEALAHMGHVGAGAANEEQWQKFLAKAASWGVSEAAAIDEAIRQSGGVARDELTYEDLYETLKALKPKPEGTLTEQAQHATAERAEEKAAAFVPEPGTEEQVPAEEPPAPPVRATRESIAELLAMAKDLSQEALEDVTDKIQASAVVNNNRIPASDVSKWANELIERARALQSAKEVLG